MGMFDMIVFLDTLSSLSCSEGHALSSLQTKDLPEPSMNTYLVQGGTLYLAVADATDTSIEAPTDWRIEGTRAIHERCHQLREVQAPRTLRAYGSCDVCEPLLVRSEAPQVWYDIVIEHPPFADFRLTFRPGEPLLIERLSGTRADLEADMRSRGLFVLSASDTLAAAHYELRRARRRALVRSTEARK